MRGRGRQFRRNRALFPLHPLKKALDFFEKAHATRPVTPHNPPLSLGFLATQGKPGRATPALGFALRSSPSEGRRGSDASSLSRLAPLRLRPVSLRLGTAIAGCARLTWLFLAPVQPGCSGGSALLRCHASPAHDARLPSDSGHKQAGCAVLGLYPSLQSIRAVRNGSALLDCHASLPSAYARFPSDSEQPLRAAPA